MRTSNQWVNFKRFHRQDGVATIMFVLMLPVLLGFIALGIDGANFLRAQADIGDAVEVASLALSARGSKDNNLNDELAEIYIKELVPDAVSIEAETKGVSCDSKTSCNNDDSDDADDADKKSRAKFYEYKVTGTATFESLFPTMGTGGLGFPETMTFSSHSAARKYEGSPVDVAFVADFSLSMNNNWKDVGRNKLVMLKSVITDVSKQVETFSPENTMTLVPYALFTGRDTGTRKCRVTEIITTEATNLVPYPTNDVDTAENIDIQRTFDEMFTEKKDCLPLDLTIYMPKEKGANNQNISEETLPNESEFHTLPLTAEASVIQDGLKNMEVSWGTASYEGIIRGAQILRKGTNPRKLLVVLSDGRDWRRAGDYHSYLLNADVTINGEEKKGVNYCEHIRKELSQHGGNTYNVTMAVIGFDYKKGKKNIYLKECVGEENLYTASNMADIKKRLLRFIGEETGHLHNG